MRASRGLSDRQTSILPNDKPLAYPHINSKHASLHASQLGVAELPLVAVLGSGNTDCTPGMTQQSFPANLEDIYAEMCDFLVFSPALGPQERPKPSVYGLPCLRLPANQHGKSLAITTLGDFRVARPPQATGS
jgi:hypothetical protein